MSNPNPYQSDGGQMNYPPQYGQQNPQLGTQPMNPRQEFLNYRFSPEELRVIRECENESFYYRSLPFGLGLGTAGYLGVKNGYFKPNVKFGPWPKVLAFSFFGYIAGRISYTKKCQEKMMALPNSRFGEMLRQKLQKKGNNWDMGSHEAGAATALSLAPFQSNVDSYSDQFSQPNSLNLDTNRPHYSGLDDTYTPTKAETNDLNEDLQIPQRKNTVTYDELRQKNRDDYAKSHYGPSYSQNNPQQQPAPGPFNPTPGPFVNQPSDNDRRRASLRTKTDDEILSGLKTGPKNKYGDVWTE